MLDVPRVPWNVFQRIIASFAKEIVKRRVHVVLALLAELRMPELYPGCAVSDVDAGNTESLGRCLARGDAFGDYRPSLVEHVLKPRAVVGMNLWPGAVDIYDHERGFG